MQVRRAILLEHFCSSLLVQLFYLQFWLSSEFSYGGNDEQILLVSPR